MTGHMCSQFEPAAPNQRMRCRCKAGISVRHSVHSAMRCSYPTPRGAAQPVPAPAAPEEEGAQVTTTGERAGAQPPGGGRTLFVRNATGLVRELSAFDAFNLVFSAVLIPVGGPGRAGTPSRGCAADMAGIGRRDATPNRGRRRDSGGGVRLGSSRPRSVTPPCAPHSSWEPCGARGTSSTSAMGCCSSACS